MVFILLTGDYINLFECTSGSSKTDYIKKYIEENFDYYKYENGKHTFKTKG